MTVMETELSLIVVINATSHWGEIKGENTAREETKQVLILLLKDAPGEGK